jgi:GT2 family glycosyltransferase
MPELSVVITPYNARETITPYLEALDRQRTSHEFEVILVDSPNDGTAELVAERFPSVRLIAGTERKFCGDARNIGTAHAKAEVLAFTGADCTVADDWVERILQAHKSGHLIIGGSVANDEVCKAVGWAAYFTEFSRWMPHSDADLVADVPGANMSHKRKVFEELGPFIEGTYCSDTESHRRAQERGYRVLFMPQICVNHSSLNGFREFIKHEFHHGRSFGLVRCRRFARMQQVVYAAGSFLLPAVLLSRIVLRNIRDRTYFSRFLKSTPILLLGVSAWSFGECVAYLVQWRRSFGTIQDKGKG